jgi:hypothetical protein
MTTTTNPLSVLPAAEQRLLDAVNSVASALEGIGKHELNAAMARLHDAAADAKSRLADARASVTACVANVVSDIEDFATNIFEDMSTVAWIPAHIWELTKAATPTAPDAELSPLGVPAVAQPSDQNSTTPVEPAEVRSMAEWSEMFGTRLEATPARQDEVVDLSAPAVETPQTPATVEAAPESPADRIASHSESQALPELSTAVPAFATVETSHSEPVVTTAANAPVGPSGEPSGEKAATSTQARKSRRTRKS